MDSDDDTISLVLCARTDDRRLHREDLIDELEEPAGATTALLEAQDAITLFM